MKLALPKLQLSKPTAWDFAALALCGLAVVVIAANILLTRRAAPGVAIGGGVTFAFTSAQLLISSISLIVLGKTARQGTIVGNLAAVGGMFLGMTGALLAAALWATA